MTGTVGRPDALPRGRNALWSAGGLLVAYAGAVKRAGALPWTRWGSHPSLHLSKRLGGSS